MTARETSPATRPARIGEATRHAVGFGRTHQGSALRTALLAFPLGALLVVQLFPVVIIVLTSMKTEVSLLEHGPFSLSGFSFGNYAKVLVEDAFLLPMGNSLLIAVLATLLSLACGATAAYALARMRFRGHGILSAGLLCGRLLPPVALALPLFVLLKKFGLTDTVTGLTLAHASFNLPFAIWLLMPFFESLPKSLEEAAVIDGCTRAQVFRHVFFPLALPGLLVTAVFCFLLSWNDFLFSLFLAGSRLKTAPLTVNGYMTGFGTEWGPMTASSVLILAPVFAFSLLLQRHLVGGIASGSLKG